MTLKLSSRDALIEAAFTVFAANPTATLAEVASKAGVGRATLHRHFAGRQDLVLALARVAADELDAAIDTAVAEADSHSEALRLGLEAMIPLANRQLFLANEPLDRVPEIAAELDDQMAVLMREIDAAKAEGTFAADVPTIWIAECYENLTYAAWRLVAQGEATPRQAAALAWRTLTTGLDGETK